MMKKNDKMINAKKVDSNAILFLFSFILCNKVKKIATVPNGSITTKYNIKEPVKISKKFINIITNNINLFYNTSLLLLKMN